MNSKEIAQTILQQIKTTDPAALMAWGSKNYVALPEVKLPAMRAGETPRLQLGGVQFAVNGRKFRGYVQVSLMSNDTYTVRTFRLYKGRMNVKHEQAEVYCEELMVAIDSVIERDYAEVA